MKIRILSACVGAFDGGLTQRRLLVTLRGLAAANTEQLSRKTLLMTLYRIIDPADILSEDLRPMLTAMLASIGLTHSDLLSFVGMFRGEAT